MAIMTIRIEDDLTSRVTAVAKMAGQTPHDFILQTVMQRVEQLEQLANLDPLAEARWSQLLDDGKTVPWDEARRYLLARARGGPTRRPTAKTSDRTAG